MVPIGLGPFLPTALHTTMFPYFPLLERGGGQLASLTPAGDESL